MNVRLLFVSNPQRPELIQPSEGRFRRSSWLGDPNAHGGAGAGLIHTVWDES
jgi:hypothetical protein